jgi:glycosyltransferase involved in cell wall biosynthesis
VSELVEDGVSGFLVPPGDVEALARRIGEIADDPGLRRRMGEAGREVVRREFDARMEAARLASLFLGQPDDSVRPPPLET